MLQISSGKFYESRDPDQLYITVHRGVLYTNYQFVSDRVTTLVGDLLPSARWGDVQTLVCEVTERLPKPGGQIRSGHVVSVAQDVLIQDFAAIVSFRMNMICTPDRDLAQRLISAQRPPLGIAAVPRQYVARMFDSSIPYKSDDINDLESFITRLISLDRKSYSGIMRAIRRYVTAMHRLADDLDLAYALLVASIESLAQDFDGFTPVWADYAEQKRKPVDKALIGAPNEIAERVRQAILGAEHVALKRRFCEFSNNYLQPTFFRQEAKSHEYPAGRVELSLALKNAYDLRSGYIHTLKPLPNNLVLNPSYRDVQIVGVRPLLTFYGLARVARHVILAFIKQLPTSEHESFDYTADYPNITRMPLDPQYWIHYPDGYSSQTARTVLNGFLTQIANRIFDPTQTITDLQLVTRKIEKLVPSMVKPAQKMPMLSLYFLFSVFLPPEEQGHFITFLEPYLQDFNFPSIDSLVVHFLAEEQKPDWSIEQSELLLKEYISQRFKKEGLNAGSLIGAGLILWVAEMYRASGNIIRARELVTYGVEEYPQQKALREFESSSQGDDMPEIKWRHVLLPHLHT